MISKKEKINEVLTRGVENIYPAPSALEKVLNSSKKLKLYTGIDPTGRLHIGHGVVLNKLRQFQELGHQVIILIGDFTAMIGDPTGKLSARKILTKQQVKANATDYKNLIGKILDPKKTKFEYNSKWLEKLSTMELIEMTHYFTAQQTLARDMFKKRLASGQDLFLNEFLYPIMQAYDSVAMDIDLEVGGNDQMFNMMAGRTLMRKMKNKEKFVLTTKLLVDPSGKKMGKTEGNMINLDDKPEEMYGKVMSWPDNMILIGLEIATQNPMSEVQTIAKALVNNNNPKDYKMQLALSVVAMYHGPKAARLAEENFKQVFQEKLNPDDIKKFKVKSTNIIDILLETKLVDSKSQARRLISQGGIKIDAKKISDENFQIKNIDQDGVVIQKGKRHFAKIIK